MEASSERERREKILLRTPLIRNRPTIYADDDDDDDSRSAVTRRTTIYYTEREQ